jgi:1,4-alpha-glucan branching enzyme
MNDPAMVLCPYDAELFGHWWFEGVDFLNFFVRKAYFDQKIFKLTTPGQFLRRHPTHQVARPAAGSWGEGGYWGMWLNEQNEWIYPHLRVAQERMTELVARHGSAQSLTEIPLEMQERALRQAGRELMLAQASDWPFILRTGTSPGYAKKRVTEHLLRFSKLYEELSSGQLDLVWLAQIESQDNIFPELDFRHFA